MKEGIQPEGITPDKRPSASKDSLSVLEVIVGPGFRKLVWMTLPTPLAWDPASKTWIPVTRVTFGDMRESLGLNKAKIAALVENGIFSP